jgi:hypothetical protein
MLSKRPVKILDRHRFLKAVMQELAGECYISFEGNLSALKFDGLRGASKEETQTLKRNTIWPKQDFIVVTLETDLIPAIMAAIGGTIPKSILHIQIERHGSLQLGAYDNFQHVSYGEALSLRFIDQLQADGIVKNTN